MFAHQMKLCLKKSVSKKYHKTQLSHILRADFVQTLRMPEQLQSSKLIHLSTNL